MPASVTTPASTAEPILSSDRRAPAPDYRRIPAPSFARIAVIAAIIHVLRGSSFGSRYSRPSGPLADTWVRRYRTRPVEMRGATGEHDDGRRADRLHLFVVEPCSESDVEDTGDDGVDAILRMLVRHPLDAWRQLDPDDVRPRVRRFSAHDCQAHRRRERRKRLPFDFFGQDRPEDGPVSVVNPSSVTSRSRREKLGTRGPSTCDDRSTLARHPVG
jgi:hypothetical protein